MRKDFFLLVDMKAVKTYEENKKKILGNRLHSVCIKYRSLQSATVIVFPPKQIQNLNRQAATEPDQEPQ